MASARAEIRSAMRAVSVEPACATSAMAAQAPHTVSR